MTEEERLKAYDEMKAWIENEYETLTEKLAALKAAEKTRTVTYRESLGRKCYYMEFWKFTRNSACKSAA